MFLILHAAVRKSTLIYLNLQKLVAFRFPLFSIINIILFEDASCNHAKKYRLFGDKLDVIKIL